MEDELLYRYFNNEAAPEEVRRIEAWLREDPAHQREFDAMHMLFNASMLRQMRYDMPERKKTPVWTLRRIGRAAVREIGRAHV